ncbi:CaiB/BaiF CoA transferase family protein [Paraburkholderia silvatlantica]|uniref:CaiB/BaiF CoA transferase family protein n=1 Tax=Paraburkholderia silvatlantica TaxID=321895 RepID=UPI0037520288
MDVLNTLPKITAGRGLECLKGVRVLDFTTSVAGPYGSLLLADLGAEVIKIEKRNGGDDIRAWGPPFLDGESLWFLSINRNKLSMTLDLTRAEGRAIAHELVRQSDVVLVNSNRRIQEKLGLDFDTLRLLRPSLIHVSVTGFGLDGDRANLPCYDLIAEGYSGIMHLTGESDRPPQKVGTPAADLLAGQDIAMATLAALFERQRTGQGKQIDISMVATATRFMTPRIVPYLGSGEAPLRSGGTDSVIAIYQVFDTADFPLTLGLGNDAIWHRFWQATGMAHFGRHPDYETNAKRRDLRETIVVEIATLLRQKSREYWLDLFAQHRIPAGPINNIEQLAADPLLRDGGMVFAAPGTQGLVPQVGLGIRFNKSSDVFRSAPPALGRDTEWILKERLSMSATSVAAMIDAEIV